MIRRSIASDDDYTLFGVVVFKRVHDEFVQKCREDKSDISMIRFLSSINNHDYRFIVRDFVYSETELVKQRRDLEMADTMEKELWVSIYAIHNGASTEHRSKRPSYFAFHEPISQSLSKFWCI